MEREEARALLLDAGIPADQIDDEAIMIASAIIEGLNRRLAKQIAERFINHVLPLMKETEKNRAKYAELGVKVG
jgi:hypothetical protein